MTRNFTTVAGNAAACFLLKNVWQTAFFYRHIAGKAGIIYKSFNAPAACLRCIYN
jgi:hypothetical protein